VRVGKGCVRVEARRISQRYVSQSSRRSRRLGSRLGLRGREHRPSEKAPSLPGWRLAARRPMTRWLRCRRTLQAVGTPPAGPFPQSTSSRSYGNRSAHGIPPIADLDKFVCIRPRDSHRQAVICSRGECLSDRAP
jgi:hypothetical protein